MNPVGDVWIDEAESPPDHYVLSLYVAGAAGHSSRAIENVKAFCEKYLAGRYELEVIDVHQEAEISEADQLIALPMLLRRAPQPERRLIGDMSDTARMLKGLGISPTSLPDAP